MKNPQAVEERCEATTTYYCQCSITCKEQIYHDISKQEQEFKASEVQIIFLSPEVKEPLLFSVCSVCVLLAG